MPAINLCVVFIYVYVYNCVNSYFKQYIVSAWIFVSIFFYPTALKGFFGIVFTHGVRMGRRAGGKKFVRAVSQKP